MVKKRIIYELKRVCKDCGHERGVSGYPIYHKTGTISFVVSYLEDKCPMCANEEEVVTEWGFR